MRPTPEGNFYLTTTYSKKVTDLPGITINLLKGPAADEGDLPYNGIYIASEYRWLLENMQIARKDSENSKSLPIADIENKLEKKLTFVSIDVNGLKLVNDSLGHEAGDELLKGAACCIQRCVGPYGKVYRIGGDEFVVLCKLDKELMSERLFLFTNELNKKDYHIDQRKFTLRKQSIMNVKKSYSH